MDHGGRHLLKKLSKVRILTMNIDLEYQKSEVNSGFYYNSAEQREKMVAAERAARAIRKRGCIERRAHLGRTPPRPLAPHPSTRWVDDRVDPVLALKKKACKEGETLLLINQKGIDPSRSTCCPRGGVALRRAKRRNMERVVSRAAARRSTRSMGWSRRSAGDDDARPRPARAPPPPSPLRPPQSLLAPPPPPLLGTRRGGPSRRSARRRTPSSRASPTRSRARC